MQLHRPLRKIDLGMVALTINVALVLGGWIWGTSQMRAAVDGQTTATAELKDATRDISRVIMDHEGRIRVLEDRSLRGRP